MTIQGSTRAKLLWKNFINRFTKCSGFDPHCLYSIPKLEEMTRWKEICFPRWNQLSNKRQFRYLRQIFWFGKGSKNWRKVERNVWCSKYSRNIRIIQTILRATQRVYHAKDATKTLWIFYIFSTERKGLVEINQFCCYSLLCMLLHSRSITNSLIICRFDPSSLPGKARRLWLFSNGSCSVILGCSIRKRTTVRAKSKPKQGAIKWRNELLLKLWVCWRTFNFTSTNHANGVMKQ